MQTDSRTIPAPAIVANRTRKADPEAPAWTAQDLARAMRRAKDEHDAWKATAEPFVLVDVGNGLVARVALIVFAVQFAIAALALAVLFALGVL